MRKVIALSSILTLLLTAMPVLANGDVPAAEITTFFTNDGWVSGFNEITMINDESEGIVEEITAWGDHTLTVLKYGDYTYHHDWDYVSLNEDKQIWYDGDCHGCGGDLYVAKYVWWGEEQLGSGDVYREAFIDPDIIDITHAGGIGTGEFLDNIETNKDTYIYQSVGLDQFATCAMPEAPVSPSEPTCEWCD